MELGGNAPFLVLADADLGQAVAGAMVAKMRNGGEACTAANRFYVHASIAGEFGRRLASAMAALTVGPGLDAGVEVGSLVNEPARKKVGELVAGIVDASVRILTGGTPPRPRRLLLPAHGAGRSSPGRAHPGAGDLRAGRTSGLLRPRQRRDPDGQRHRVRPGGARLHRRPGGPRHWMQAWWA
jgi:hypothetical protein